MYLTPHLTMVVKFTMSALAVCSIPTVHMHTRVQNITKPSLHL